MFFSFQMSAKYQACRLRDLLWIIKYGPQLGQQKSSFHGWLVDQKLTY